MIKVGMKSSVIKTGRRESQGEMERTDWQDLYQPILGGGKEMDPEDGFSGFLETKSV